MKRCSSCGERKPADAFWLDRRRGEPKHACKGCCRVAARVWRAKNPEKERARYRSNPDRARANHYARKYGITLADYARMLTAQEGACAVCRRPEPDDRKLDVDHCHRTGRVRGLLCTSCNRMIGHSGDSVETLARAAAYLQSAKPAPTCYSDLL